MSLFDTRISINPERKARLENLKRELAKDPENFKLNVLFAKNLVDYSVSKKNARVALTHLKRALSQKDDLEARAIYVTALRQHQEYEYALEYASMIPMEPYESLRLCNDVARIYLAKNEYKIARTKFEEGLKYFPGEDRLIRGLISVLEHYFPKTKDMKLLDRAISLSDHLIKEDPENLLNIQIKLGLVNLNPVKSDGEKIDNKIGLFEDYLENFPETYYGAYEISRGNYYDYSLSCQHAETLHQKFRLEAIKIAKNTKKKKLTYTDVLKLPEMAKIISDAITIIDDTIKRNNDAYFSLALKLKLDLTLKLSQSKEALYTCEDILRVESDNMILYRKGLIHIRLGDFKMGEKIFEQLLVGEEKTKNKLTLHEKRLECLVGLKLTKEIKHEKKTIRDLKKTLKEEEKNYSSDTKKQKLDENQIAENLDTLDMKSISESTWNDPRDPEGNKRKWAEHWKKMKHNVSWVDHYVNVAVLEETDELVDFDESGIACLRILSKAGYDEHSKDGGKSFYKKLKTLKGSLETLSKNNKKCKIEYRMFFTLDRVEDLFHRRVLFDNERVYVLPGNEQAWYRPKYDDYRLCKHNEAANYRKDYQNTWDNAHDIEDKKFLELFVRHVIMQEKECAKIIEEENPKLVSKIKDELLPKRNDNRAYITDESIVSSYVKKILKKFPQIAKMSTDKSLKKVMTETQGKLDPDTVKKILQEISGP